MNVKIKIDYTENYESNAAALAAGKEVGQVVVIAPYCDAGGMFYKGELRVVLPAGHEWIGDSTA